MNSNFYPVIVGHGLSKFQEETLNKLLESENLVYHYLSAPKKYLARGYPINIALKHITKIADASDLIAFLDDDDLIYPNVNKFLELNAVTEIIVATVNRRNNDWGLELHGPLLPSFILMQKNIYPINSFAIRIGFIKDNDISMREDLDYHEDWEFLTSLLNAKAKFEYLDEIVAEYRMMGDGNSVIRKNPISFDDSVQLLKYINKGRLKKINDDFILEEIRNWRQSFPITSPSIDNEILNFLNERLGNERT